MRVIRNVRKHGAQRRDRCLHRLAVGRKVTAERQRVRHVTHPVNQPDIDVPLGHMTRLPHLAAVQADEIGVLGRIRRRVALAVDQRLIDRRYDLAEKSFGAHQCSPPKTSTLVNTHAGDA